MGIRDSLTDSEVSLSNSARDVQQMFDRIAPRYDLLNRLLSLRQDVRWRRSLCGALPRSSAGGQSVLDVACGTGDVMIEILKSRPDFAKVVGLDLSRQMLEKAQVRHALTQELGKKVSLVHGTATSLPFEDDSFEALTISFGLRNVDDRQKALSEFRRVLKPGGRLFVLEFFPLKKSLMGFLFEFYFRKILPLVGGIISDKNAYRYLPDSVGTMPCISEFNGLLQQAKLKPVRLRSWLFGGCLLVEAEKV